MDQERNYSLIDLFRKEKIMGFLRDIFKDEDKLDDFVATVNNYADVFKNSMARERFVEYFEDMKSTKKRLMKSKVNFGEYNNKELSSDEILYYYKTLRNNNEDFQVTKGECLLLMHVSEEAFYFMVSYIIINDLT